MTVRDALSVCKMVGAVNVGIAVRFSAVLVWAGATHPTRLLRSEQR